MKRQPPSSPQSTGHQKPPHSKSTNSLGLTLKQAAKVTGIKIHDLRKKISGGKLPACKGDDGTNYVQLEEIERAFPHHFEDQADRPEHGLPCLSEDGVPAPLDDIPLTSPERPTSDSPDKEDSSLPEGVPETNLQEPENPSKGSEPPEAGLAPQKLDGKPAQEQSASSSDASADGQPAAELVASASTEHGKPQAENTAPGNTTNGGKANHAKDPAPASAKHSAREDQKPRQNLRKIGKADSKPRARRKKRRNRAHPPNLSSQHLRTLGQMLGNTPQHELLTAQRMLTLISSLIAEAATPRNHPDH